MLILDRGYGGYEFAEVLGVETRIPGDWSALIRSTTS